MIHAAAPGDAEIGELWNRIQTDFHLNIVRAGFEELYVLPNWLSPAP